MQEGSVPTISNIQVNQTGELDIQKDSGIGFFGTISNEMKKVGMVVSSLRGRRE